MTELPKHFLIPVDKDGRGPVPVRSAARFVCWCSERERCTVITATTSAPKEGAWPMAVSEDDDEYEDTLTTLEHSGTPLTNVHRATECAGRPCPIHNRTDHDMRTFYQQWNSATKMTERVCSHGIAHPDPDEFVYLVRRYGQLEAAKRFKHKCDGCGHGPDDDAIFDALTEDEYI